MPNFSPGLQLAWHIAGAEAAMARHQFIEPEHLFIGACKLVNRPSEPAAAKPDVPQDLVLALNTEAKAVHALFADFHLDRVEFYRQVRQRMGGGSYDAQKQRKMSRSPASKAAFQQAEELAAGAAAVNSLHLMAALFSDAGAGIARQLKEKGADVAAMKATALRLAWLEAGPPEPEAEPAVEIEETFDAKVSSFDPSGSTDGDRARRLSLLYELPLQFATATRLDVLLQDIVERLLSVVPSAARGALLLAEPESGSLVLKAHLPAGGPAVSMTLAQRAMTKREGFVWREGEGSRIPSASFHGIGTGMYAPLISRDSVLGVICADNPNRDTTFSNDDLRLLVSVAHYAALAVAHQRALDDLRRHTELTHRLFTSRFAPQVRENLLRAAATGSLPVGTRQSHITILISDVRGFTQLTAQMGAQRAGDLMNEYFPPLIDAVHAHHGTIERLAGDGIFAVFGSPEPDDQQHEHAVRAALAMQAATAIIMKGRAARKAETCEIGIGIDCGDALHGFVGNADRLEYHVVGQPANLASRYCASAGKSEILISPEVHARVFNKFKFERVEITTKEKGTLCAYRIKGEIF